MRVAHLAFTGVLQRLSGWALSPPQTVLGRLRNLREEQQASLFYHDQSNPLSGGLKGSNRFHFPTLITPRNCEIITPEQRNPLAGSATAFGLWLKLRSGLAFEVLQPFWSQPFLARR